MGGVVGGVSLAMCAEGHARHKYKHAHLRRHGQSSRQRL